MITDSNETRQLAESDREFISDMINRIGTFYPEASAKATLEYKERTDNWRQKNRGIVNYP